MANSRDKQQKLRDAEDTENIRFVLGDRRGRAFVWWLFGVSGIELGSFHTNALTMAHNEGRRSVGNQLRSEILDVDAESYLTMQREAYLAEKQETKPEQESSDE